MAFAENLYFLRKKNRITQEELADCLDVSRQSVSKWETGEAYPETEKLIALCDKFNVSLDDLLRGDLTEAATPEKSEETGVERHIYPDEHGFARHMDGFSHRIAAGVFLILFGVAACVALEGYSLTFKGKTADLTGIAGVVVLLLFIAVAVFIFVFSGIEHDRFKKAHPVMQNVFAEYEVHKFLKKFPVAMACLVSSILLGVVMLIVLSALIDGNIIRGGDPAYCYVTATFLLIIAFAASGLTYFGIQKTKYDVAEYNRETDKELNPTPREKLKNAICGAVMLTATALFLVLGFVWSLWHPGWVVFPVGGIVCGIVGAILGAKDDH
ncbi:MAG: helix-turn-helix domain-containing protein [Clostridia bacterium]|nr:helix-turn-helix domain-containing protein [Clostridia bacterium]